MGLAANSSLRETPPDKCFSVWRHVPVYCANLPFLGRSGARFHRARSTPPLLRIIVSGAGTPNERFIVTLIPRGESE